MKPRQGSWLNCLRMTKRLFGTRLSKLRRLVNQRPRASAKESKTTSGGINRSKPLQKRPQTQNKPAAIDSLDWLHSIP